MGNMNHNFRKKSISETDPELTQMLESAEKSIKNHDYNYIQHIQRDLWKIQKDPNCTSREKNQEMNKKHLHGICDKFDITKDE